MVQARFVTETGWISWPSFITMAPTLDPKDYGFNSSVTDSRVQHPPAQREMTHNVVSNWIWPDAHPSTTAEGYRDELWMTQVQPPQQTHVLRPLPKVLKSLSFSKGLGLLGGKFLAHHHTMAYYRDHVVAAQCLVNTLWFRADHLLPVC